MKKNLLTLTLIGGLILVKAQTNGTFMDVNAKMSVSKGALVYNTGSLVLKDNAQVINGGNVMIVGGASDVFRTLKANGDPKLESEAGGNFINKINEPNNYGSINSANPANAPVYTYGQLYIEGLTQNNITGYIDQEYRAVKHGAYQQIAMPFYSKTLSTLSSSAELGKGFTNTRWSENEILFWDNNKAVFRFSNINGVTADASAYFILGSKNLDTSSKVFTVKGRPYAEESVISKGLYNAGYGIDYGLGGINKNEYNERYNSYLQDGFHIASGGTAWQPADNDPSSLSYGRGFGKNLYQFGNPFLTNLDLTRIGFNEGPNGDGVNLPTIQGIRLEVSGVKYTTNVGGGSTSYKYVTFDNFGNPIGDLDYLVVRPMGTFVIKLKDNTAANAIDFKKLRRFNYYPRIGNDYSVTAARVSSKKASTITKQLGVIALDADGNEIGRTYYVVYPDATTGNSTKANTQVTAFSNNIVGTYEEALNGGYDYNQTSKYWLYINEANENDFKGKNIKLVNYSDKIKSYKFEIRENAQLVNDGTHLLSSGEGFYIKDAKNNGSLIDVKQMNTIPVTSTEYDLYYGKPQTDGTLGTNEGKTPSRTKILYIEDAKKYIVKFDPNWKKADIYIHDMSGRLIFSDKNVSASSDYLIKLDDNVNNAYIVNVISELGEKVTSKIIK